MGGDFAPPAQRADFDLGVTDNGTPLSVFVPAARRRPIHGQAEYRLTVPPARLNHVFAADAHAVQHALPRVAAAAHQVLPAADAAGADVVREAPVDREVGVQAADLEVVELHRRRTGPGPQADLARSE